MSLTFALRGLGLATLFFVVPSVASAQAPCVLRITVALLDAAQKPTPVPRHVLLVSDNPATALPRRIVTAPDGTAKVTLPPGSHTVESDRPVAFGGKAYQWTQLVDIAACGDTVLELTADNAEVELLASATTTPGAPLEADPSFLLPQWQDSVVGLWTPTSYASGFVVDARGLVATNQRGIGNTTAVEVELTPTVKVAASVLAADPARDVAILWIDPAASGLVRPVPLGCAQEARPSLASDEEIFAIGAPFREPKGMTSGTVSRVDPQAIVSDLSLARGSAGGPVFAAGGVVVGITAVVDERDERGRGDTRVIPLNDVCEVVKSAETRMQGQRPPSGTHLPIEPARPFPMDALKDAAQRRAGSLNPYQMSSSDFDVAFITPVLVYGAQQSERARASPLMEFGSWSEYVAVVPPVLLVRVTPKMVERFWTTVARGAARTQGVAIPAIKHIKAGFARMRVFCGDAEVTPIHPFKVEQRVSDSEAVYQGLYVFDPVALGPQCETVTLRLYSEKEPERADTRVVEPKIIQQIWEDFAPYRAQ